MVHMFAHEQAADRSGIFVHRYFEFFAIPVGARLVCRGVSGQPALVAAALHLIVAVHREVPSSLSLSLSVAFFLVFSNLSFCCGSVRGCVSHGDIKRLCLDRGPFARASSYGMGPASSQIQVIVSWCPSRSPLERWLASASGSR